MKMLKLKAEWWYHEVMIHHYVVKLNRKMSNEIGSHI